MIWEGQEYYEQFKERKIYSSKNKNDLETLAKEASDKNISYGQLMVQKFTKSGKYK